MCFYRKIFSIYNLLQYRMISTICRIWQIATLSILTIYVLIGSDSSHYLILIRFWILSDAYVSDDESDDSSVEDEDKLFFEVTKAIFFFNIFFLFFSRFLFILFSIWRASTKISSHSSSIPINPKMNPFLPCFLSPGRGSRSNDRVSSRYLDWNSIVPELVRTLCIERRQEKIVEIFCSVLKLLNTTSSM